MLKDNKPNNTNTTDTTDNITSELHIDNFSTLADIKSSLNKLEVVNTLFLGEGKEIILNKWNGKQLIKYGKEIEKISNDINNEGDPEVLLQKIPNVIIEYLIKPNVIDFDTYYFNSYEIKHILINLRKISVPSLPITYDIICDNITDKGICNHTETVTIDINSITEEIHTYKNGNLVLSNGINLYISDIRNIDVLNNQNDSKLDNSISLINEICMRVNKVTFNNQSTDVIIFADLLDIILSLPSEIFSELIDKYLTQFGFTQTIKDNHYICPKCHKKHNIPLDDALLYVEGI